MKKKIWFAGLIRYGVGVASDEAAEMAADSLLWAMKRVGGGRESAFSNLMQVRREQREYAESADEEATEEVRRDLFREEIASFQISTGYGSGKTDGKRRVTLRRRRASRQRRLETGDR